MSVERTETIDALTMRDGWAVLSVHEFGDWNDIEDADVMLARKLLTYFDHVRSPHFQARFHRTPVRVSLVSRDPVPESVREICARSGVDIEVG